MKNSGKKTPNHLPSDGNSEDVNQPTQPSVGMKSSRFHSNIQETLEDTLIYPFISCEGKLDLLSTKDCVLIEYHNNINSHKF